MNLKPCPNCGKAAVMREESDFAYCPSYECNMQGPDNDENGDKWNSLPRRGDASVPKADEDRLMQQLAEARDRAVAYINSETNKPIYTPTRRDYFVAAALTGYFSKDTQENYADSSVVDVCINVADQLIRELDKKESPK